MDKAPYFRPADIPVLATSDDVLRIAVGLADLKQRLLALGRAGDYDAIMEVYGAMRGIEIDTLALTTLAGKLATDLVMR
jgi:hypothetical protein